MNDAATQSATPATTRPTTQSATQPTTLPNGGKQPVSNKLIIAVVSLAILTFLGILSETSLNIAYSTLMEEFSIGASVVQWLTTGYLLLLSVSIPSSPFMVRKFATKTLFIMAIVIFAAGTLLGALALLPGAVVGAVSAPVIGGMLKNHFPPKFIIIGFAGTMVMDVVFVVLSGNVWVVAIAYAFFMAFSGFVLVPDQTHALNQLPARLNADGSAAMNTIQQLAGAIGTAVASALISGFSAAAVNNGADDTDCG